MSLFLDIEENLPMPIIHGLSASVTVPLHRVGNFHEQKTGAGCGRTCIWNGGGYYMDLFVCGKTYPSGLTFYCCSDCHRKIGDSEKVFLSFPWCDVEIADKIAGCARGAAIDIMRDVNEIGFLDAISSFMNTAAESRYFVAVMTESYFFSRYCMYEFCQLSESDQQIRTIPVMLGTTVEPGIEEMYKEYWRGQHRNLNEAIRGIERKYTAYLQRELDLLASVPGHIEDFYALWRARDRPKGERWLMVNCRFLVGAIKTTFTPTDEDATNWTYSNKTVSAYRADDAAPTATWEPEPFYLHACSMAESQVVSGLAGAQKLILDVYHDASASQSPSAGVHLALISDAALSSLVFCRRLQYLLDRDDVTLVPLFVDETLQKPASEVGLLRRWSDRLADTGAGTVREEIDSMLSGFGAMICRLRDTLVRSADVDFS